MRLGLGYNLRTIIHNDSYEQVKKRMPFPPERVDEIFEAIEWHLARMPEWGYRVGKTDLFAQRMDLPFYEKEVTFFYTFDEDHVEIHDVFGI